MTEETLKKAATAYATKCSLSNMIDDAKNKEVKIPGLCYAEVGAFPDESYLLSVQKEIKAATIRILTKHQKLKQAEFEKTI